MLQISRHHDVVCVKGTVGSPKANLDIYVFLVDGMLVDTGPSSLLNEYIAFFEKSSFNQVALTHVHEDHTGGAAWIEKNKSVPLYIHSDSIAEASKKGEYPMYRQLVWGQREPFTALPIADQIQSDNYSWRVLSTPGHADDHLSLLNKETGVLFSGDLFVTPKPKMMLSWESVPTIISSINSLLSYDFGPMFCSHAGFIEDGKKMLKMKLEYLENIAGEILFLHERGLPVKEIDQKLFPVKHPLVHFSNGEWDSKHIISSVIKGK